MCGVVRAALRDAPPPYTNLVLRGLVEHERVELLVATGMEALLSNLRGGSRRVNIAPARIAFRKPRKHSGQITDQPSLHTNSKATRVIPASNAPPRRR